MQKLEFYKPLGSVKDRIGKYMIEDTIQKELLKPEGTIVEITARNLRL